MNHPRLISRILFVVFALALLLASCLGSPNKPDRSPSPTNTIFTTPTSQWNRLVQLKAFPYTTPLPEEVRTPIDGTYAKLDLSKPQWWACRRCADYRPAGGIWKLQFDKGTMRIYYDVTGWRSLASYTVEGDRLTLFNDPYCKSEVGEYTWRVEDGSLALQVVDDPCSIELRGINLSAMPWQACQPDDLSPACAAVLVPPETPEPPTIGVTVAAHPGDARHFTVGPDLTAAANAEVKSPPEGITVTHSADSIPYGLNRVLWGEGSYVEISTDVPFEAMGVQVLGDHTIGWARLLFDGQEVWSGDTSRIGSKQGRFGGYIEVYSFLPGKHTLRLESMGFDYHPVTVAFFGFSWQGRVQMEE
jgi:hypothetical protein